MRVKSVPDVKFCLMFRCETLSVPVMRRVLGDTLRGLGVDEESVYDLLLAATEACTNVLQHSGREVRGYAVVTSLGAVGCQVEVADEGVGAVLHEAGPRELPAPGGPETPAQAHQVVSGRPAAALPGGQLVRHGAASPREPKGAGADWTDERGTSEEGRRRLKGARRRAKTTE
jgi:histidine kinase-like protein